MLITDALSYSATDIFAAGFQDNEVGPVLGTSGNTGAGGANFWSLDDLLRAHKKDPTSPFRTLPKGAEMIVAMRRSIRVGPRAGSPLEEFGVSPDVLHRMTRRDVLNDNVDLLARAARIIRQQPSFQLSLTPGSAEGASEVIVSAASKVPPSKAGRRISRVDIYVNGRPGPSIDAVEGYGAAYAGADRKRGQEAGGGRSPGVGSHQKACRRHSYESVMGQSIGAPKTLESRRASG